MDTQFILLCLVVFLLCLIINNWIRRKKEKRCEDISKKYIIVEAIILGSLSVFIMSYINYYITRNNLDFIKVTGIYVVLLSIVSGLGWLQKKGMYIKLVKFIGVPMCILITFLAFMYMSKLTINDMGHPYVGVLIGTGIIWLFKEGERTDSPRRMDLNFLYLFVMGIFTVSLFYVFNEDFFLKVHYCEEQVIKYLIEEKGYKEDEFSIYTSNYIEKGESEISQVEFNDDESTYVYEFFYESNTVKQISVIERKDSNFKHIEEGSEIIE